MSFSEKSNACKTQKNTIFKIEVDSTHDSPVRRIHQDSSLWGHSGSATEYTDRCRSETDRQCTLYTNNHTVSIPDIIDCNLRKDYRILIIFSRNISDDTGDQTTVRVPTSHNVCSCTSCEKQNKRNVRWNKKKSINFIAPDLWPPTTLALVRLLTMFAVSCSSESIGRRLGMSMNSRSNWSRTLSALL